MLPLAERIQALRSRAALCEETAAQASLMHDKATMAEEAKRLRKLADELEAAN